LILYDIGNPSVYRGLNARGVAKYSEFGPIEGYTSETVQGTIATELELIPQVNG